MTTTFEDDEQHQQQQSSSGNGGQQQQQEREARSLALEKAYVHDVYDQIAPHFAHNRHKPWPRVSHFLLELEPGSLVCDVGCGNGKYLAVNPDVFQLGSDRCLPLASIASLRHHEVLVTDNMQLPFREESFDAALSIAVIHHLATTERRVQALRELARILRLGGKLMISVWALEQRHRRFESQDVLVPWHKPVESSSEEQMSHAEGELTSTTTSEDDLLNYHAHSQLDSDSYYVPSHCGRRRHKLRASRGKGVLDGMCQSSSQSSSDLSSPNETCYSFVRRALAKFSSSRSWDDPHHRCRPPWFMQTTTDHHSTNVAGAGRQMEQQDSNDSSENAEDLPIELHDVDTQMAEPKTPPPLESSGRTLQQSQSMGASEKKKPQLNHKSKSLGDILSLFPVNFLRPRKSSNDEKMISQQKNGIVRSMSSHTHLARVEEEAPPSKANSTFPPQTSSTSVRRGVRPRSLILQGERTLNADDYRNGNTILPEVEGEHTDGEETGQQKRRQQPVVSSKRASWPVAPQSKLSVFNGKTSSKNELVALIQKREEKVETGVSKWSKALSRVWSCKLYRPSPIRLKKQSDDIDDKVVKDILYQNFINQVIEQEHLFPSHSMPELHLRTPHSGPKMHNGYRNNRSLSVDVSRHKVVLQQQCNGFVKRSISLENPGSEGLYLELSERERIYCNRITKEDSLQRDTSFDSDDSVASVIAVTRERLPSNEKQSSPETLIRSMSTGKEGSTHSDTSLDSEDSCISVIAMPLKDPILMDPPPPDVLQDYTDPLGATCTLSPQVQCEILLPDLLRGPVAFCNEMRSVVASCTDVQTTVGTGDKVPSVAASCNMPTGMASFSEVAENRKFDKVNEVTQNNSLVKKYCEAANDAPLSMVLLSQQYKRGSMVDLSYTTSKSESSSCRKVLRKTGSLPEQSESRLEVEGLTNHSTLSASTDFSLRMSDSTELSVSGSLSSSRSSSSSSVSWEKFLDASHSVVLDNIAIVTAGSDVIRSGKGSTAILKNASEHSHLLQTATQRRKQNKKKQSECKCSRTNSRSSLKENSDCNGSKSCCSKFLVYSEKGEEPPSKNLLQAATSMASSLQGALSMAVTNSMPRKNEVHGLEDDQVDKDDCCEESESCSSMRKETDVSSDECQEETKEEIIEFKEAGVQTSLILYSSARSDDQHSSVSEKRTTNRRSQSQEDELNGNVMMTEGEADVFTPIAIEEVSDPGTRYHQGENSIHPVNDNEGKLRVTPADSDTMLTSLSSSIESKHFGNLELMAEDEKGGVAGQWKTCNQSSGENEEKKEESHPRDSKCLSQERSLSLSTSDESLQCGGDTGGSMTFHRYYHVFREGELDQLIDKYVENLHIIASYYDHANWCVIAEKVQVWRI